MFHPHSNITLHLCLILLKSDMAYYSNDIGKDLHSWKFNIKKLKQDSCKTKVSSLLCKNTCMYFLSWILRWNKKKQLVHRGQSWKAGQFNHFGDTGFRDIGNL